MNDDLPNQKIWKEGFDANYNDIPRSANPHEIPDNVSDWYCGWDEAKEIKDINIDEKIS